MAGLSIVGVMFVYSACSIREDPDLQMLYIRHAEMALLGLVLYFLAAWFDFRSVLRSSWLFYGVSLVLLALVPVIGEETMGARRWLFGIQPSEPAKLAIILLLAWLYGRRDANRGAPVFFLTLVLVGVPGLLILMQPDLGTAMVLVPTVLAMLFAANVAPRLLWTCVLTGAVLAGVILGLIYAAERADLPQERRDALIRATCLKPHQVKRLQVLCSRTRISTAAATTADSRRSRWGAAASGARAISRASSTCSGICRRRFRPTISFSRCWPRRPASRDLSRCCSCSRPAVVRAVGGVSLSGRYGAPALCRRGHPDLQPHVHQCGDDDRDHADHRSAPAVHQLRTNVHADRHGGIGVGPECVHTWT
jgi:hypothetical protein